MNDFYGIDPKAPSNLSELSGLIRLFSPSEGRFIADFPMGWANELREHMSSLSDLCRMATVETWIQLSGYAILPTKKLYRSNLTWAENASFLKSDVVKLIGPTGKISNTVEPLDHILSEPNAFRDSRAGLIPRTSSAYAEIARPILLRSRKVVLIDPFLTFRHIPDNSNQ